MSEVNNRPPARLVIFDWDGTLIDSIGAIVDCTRAVFEVFGMQPAREDTVRKLIGSGLAESIRVLAPGCDDQTFRRVVDTYRRLWFETYHGRSSLFSGAREVMEGLRGDGRLLAVATAKARRGLRLDLERLGMGSLLDASRTADEAPSKPSPVMLLEILEELGIRGREALMVGDSVHDVQMAHNAGVPVVAVSSGAASASELRAVGPLACLAGVGELPSWLDGETVAYTLD